MLMATPAVGEMILYDYIEPPLLDGQYRMHVETDVKIAPDPNPQPLDAKDAFFNIEGPRFSLSPTEVSTVVPPRNSHGAFDSALPHIALGRRTLPWERALAQTLAQSDDGTPYPWLALVLFEEGEYTLLTNQLLEDVVPADVFNRLGRPPNVHCDAVEADEQLLRSILPMPSELQLLTHVRQVNVDDRELSAGDSGGFFAVVMANRIPSPGVKHRACLVSVEERTDLLPTADVTFVSGIVGIAGVIEAAGVPGAAPAAPVAAAAVADTADIAEIKARLQSGGTILAEEANLLNFGNATRATSPVFTLDPNTVIRVRPRARLVLLHSWSFTCEGEGTFRELMQHLNVGMIGQVDAGSRLQVTDTGHTAVDVTNRLGAPERAWYRGPLVPQPLTRDPSGPYHSADQARRIAADTGAEDVSYACAFEVGRLLAAADARLGQELMRWRRGAYTESSSTAASALVASRMPLVVSKPPLGPLANIYAVSALARVAQGAGPLGDPYALGAVETSPLLRPAAIQQAFGLATVQEATALLGRQGVLDTPVAAQAVAVTEDETLAAVMADTAGNAALAGLRARVIDNVDTQLNATLPREVP
jgi:hypothetical protein